MLQVEEIAIANVNDGADLEGIDFISDEDQYLTFDLGQEVFGVDILRVTEIRGWEEPTLLPNSPSYVKGVINIRGLIVPIIDLRARFSLGELSYLPTTVVIVLNCSVEGVQRTMGFVVDAVSDVLNTNSEQIKPPLAFGGSIKQDNIEGMVNTPDHIVTLLKVPPSVYD